MMGLVTPSFPKFAHIFMVSPLIPLELGLNDSDWHDITAWPEVFVHTFLEAFSVVIPHVMALCCVRVLSPSSC